MNMSGGPHTFLRGCSSCFCFLHFLRVPPVSVETLECKPVNLQCTRMLAASGSRGEGQPWVLEVMGLPFPTTDSGVGGSVAAVWSFTCHLLFLFPSFQVKRTLFINGISKYAEPEKIKKHFE